MHDRGAGIFRLAQRKPAARRPMRDLAEAIILPKNFTGKETKKTLFDVTVSVTARRLRVNTSLRKGTNDEHCEGHEARVDSGGCGEHGLDHVNDAGAPSRRAFDLVEAAHRRHPQSFSGALAHLPRN